MENRTKIFGVIYLTCNTAVTPVKCYVGQSIHQRCKTIDGFYDYGYYGSGVRFINALKKYGKEKFTVTVLETVTSKAEADAREKFWISEINCLKPVGYNLSSGGIGSPGCLPSAERIEYLKIKMKGSGNPMFGRKHSIETKNKIRRKQLAYQKRAKNPMFGRKHSKDTRDKISKALKGKYTGERSLLFGRTFSDRHKKNISLAKIGKPNFKCRGISPSPACIEKAREVNAKLTENQVLEIKKLLLCGNKCKDIGIKYGVQRTTIWQIKSGKNWKHVVIKSTPPV